MKLAILAAAVLAPIMFALPAGSAQDRGITVTSLEAILKKNLRSGGGTAAIVATIPAGDTGMGILVMSKNRLYHHDRQDHVLYLVRGSGTARLENASGKIETRPIKPGDILELPRGKKHGFEKTGDQDLVFLVVSAPGSDALEDTVFDE